MPRLTFLNTFGGAGTFDPFASWQYRYAPYPCRVRILAWTTASTPTLQVRTGTEQIQDTSPLPVSASATKVPTVFDVDPLDFAAPAGDLLSALITAPAACTVTGIIDVNPRT